MNFKKPSFWDLKKPNIFSNILLPFTVIIKINNFFKDMRLVKKEKKIKTICIGNIYVGGTGKTPTTIAVYKIIKKIKKKISVGKKYYSNHFDEHKILKKNSNLILGSSRSEVVKKGIQNKNEIIIFDDGLQDKNINYDIKFVCFHEKNWIGNGRLIPAGPLRELKESLKRYDGAFIQNLGYTANSLKNSIKKINPKIKIFRTKYEPVNIKKFSTKKKYLIFSGIGNPQNFKKILLMNKIKIIRELRFPDHYEYKKNDILNIKKIAKKLDAEILTTEKDFVKIKKNDQKDIGYLIIKIKILNSKKLTDFIKLKLYG